MVLQDIENQQVDKNDHIPEKVTTGYLAKYPW